MLKPQPSDPIGVFDSGIGGLSILKALQEQMPNERFVYLADSAHAPYGEKSVDFILERSLLCAKQLYNQYHIKALVVACNTATAEAIASLRQAYADLIVVGIEPAIKPAICISQTKHIAVLATRRTINSQKFLTLLNNLEERQESGATFYLQTCDGLADAIEKANLQKSNDLIRKYLSDVGYFGDKAIDTLVLGCTHYPLALDLFKNNIKNGTHLIYTGKPVALRTVQQLHESQLEALENKTPLASSKNVYLTTGNASELNQATQIWLGQSLFRTPLVLFS